MSVVAIVTAFPIPEHREEVVAAFEAAIPRVHEEPGVEVYALHEGPDRLVMIEEYASQEARAEHLKGAALADLRSALDGTLSHGRAGPRAAAGRRRRKGCALTAVR
jgi:quinol monooxygenase YgiN